MAPCVLAVAAFVLYSLVAVATMVYLIWWVPPEVAATNIFVYIGICSLGGSLTVSSCKVSELEGPGANQETLHYDWQQHGLWMMFMSRDSCANISGAYTTHVCGWQIYEWFY
jgi:hypothetical protein